jgi:crotonobetainyl-CoA:carnitine CoA-transferase CaiB-like acyl-CoA transferase
VCIVAGSDANFARLCKAMDRPDLLDDPRFTKLADRAAHGDEINSIVTDWTRARTAAEIERACIDCDVPVATAYTAADMFADAHFAARGDLVPVEDPVAGTMRQQAPFPRFAGEPPATPSGAPRLGANTRDVLAGALGMSEADLDGLAADGVI